MKGCSRSHTAASRLGRLRWLWRLAAILGSFCFLGAIPTAVAQTSDHPATRPTPAWKGLEDAKAARGQRFVEAVNAFSAGESEEEAKESVPSAYVMIDLPPVAADAERKMVLEFRGIRADTLATFYNEACKGQRDAVHFQCSAARFTTTITQKLPVEPACQLLEALVLTACHIQPSP